MLSSKLSVRLLNVLANSNRRSIHYFWSILGLATSSGTRDKTTRGHYLLFSERACWECMPYCKYPFSYTLNVAWACEDILLCDRVDNLWDSKRGCMEKIQNILDFIKTPKSGQISVGSAKRNRSRLCDAKAMNTCHVDGLFALVTVNLDCQAHWT